MKIINQIPLRVSFVRVCGTGSKKLEEHDIVLRREILSQDHYSYKTGSRERGQMLQSIAYVLNSMQQRQYKVTSRSISDYLN